MWQAWLAYAGSLAAQTVTNISAAYRNGQIFITWTNIPGVDSGFYYVYTNSEPITNTNFSQSVYLGRVPYNSAFNFRLTYALRIPTLKEYFVINDAPKQVLDSTQGFFVMNCTQANAPAYFAVRCDYGSKAPNWSVTAGSNATVTPVYQQLDPIKAYFVKKIKAGGKNDSMEIYVHYGGKVGVGTYPAMANEGCLAFHFGIIKKGTSGSLPMYIKFHGGNGDFVNAAISANLGDCWKVTLDDWIPAFKLNPEGANTRWLGYHEAVDIYNLNSATLPPTSGIIKAYTFHRVEWTLRWIISNWPGAIDTNRMYLNGVSMGCGAALLLATLRPERYVGAVISMAKYNLNAPDDSNPDCKFNEGKSARSEVRRLWGNEDSVNLSTDIPKPNHPGEFFRVYDLTNTNHMLDYIKYKPVPVIHAINGKSDELTCWEEKVHLYQTVQSLNIGGYWYWDLRDHDGENAMWSTLKLSRLSPLTVKSSYPAFSNGELDGNPGSIPNPQPPYYSGDDIGTLHGFYQFNPSSVIDSASFWQAFVWIEADTLLDNSLIPAALPTFARVDITLQRTQHFKGFPKKTTLYWCNIHNGDTIKIGTIKQKYANGVPKPLTIKKVKIYPEGNIIRVQTTPFSRIQALTDSGRPSLTVYPNPSDGRFTICLPAASQLKLQVYALTGALLAEHHVSQITEGSLFSFDASGWPPGSYLLVVTSESFRLTQPLIRQ
ncbi:MAG: T9SS type A sorting domain-containing protein [Chitinophagales bacterium]|nr:T9SS type A sorting domain-containing protein [Chitinophagales bacterium]MDW8427706.1 T9SS type A sorting domain-containing protein [Chitinophagales bacterium]